ncbi:hypothetical protein DFJ63DRAFT_333769 [Scheffersomyces coipomensis]|uniref:uncharacterized protein n=1 Tax=Scheffersomyces coipomensis TaxID=1788519 RepID=UPI00315D4DED
MSGSTQIYNFKIDNSLIIRSIQLVQTYLQDANHDYLENASLLYFKELEMKREVEFVSELDSEVPNFEPFRKEIAHRLLCFHQFLGNTGTLNEPRHYDQVELEPPFRPMMLLERYLAFIARRYFSQFDTFDEMQIEALVNKVCRIFIYSQLFVFPFQSPVCDKQWSTIDAPDPNLNVPKNPSTYYTSSRKFLETHSQIIPNVIDEIDNKIESVKVSFVMGICPPITEILDERYHLKSTVISNVMRGILVPLKDLLSWHYDAELMSQVCYDIISAPDFCIHVGFRNSMTYFDFPVEVNPKLSIDPLTQQRLAKIKCSIQCHKFTDYSPSLIMYRSLLTYFERYTAADSIRIDKFLIDKSISLIHQYSTDVKHNYLDQAPYNFIFKEQRNQREIEFKSIEDSRKVDYQGFREEIGITTNISTNESRATTSAFTENRSFYESYRQLEVENLNVDDKIQLVELRALEELEFSDIGFGAGNTRNESELLGVLCDRESIIFIKLEDELPVLGSDPLTLIRTAKLKCKVTQADKNKIDNILKAMKLTDADKVDVEIGKYNFIKAEWQTRFKHFEAVGDYLIRNDAPDIKIRKEFLLDFRATEVNFNQSINEEDFSNLFAIQINEPDKVVHHSKVNNNGVNLERPVSKEGRTETTNATPYLYSSGLIDWPSRSGRSGHERICGFFLLMDQVPQNYPSSEFEYQNLAAISLKSIHERGLIHGDIKYQNFKYDATKRKVIFYDFGLSRFDIQRFSKKSAALLGSTKAQQKEELVKLNEAVADAFRYRYSGTNSQV